jgi:hypothetical protein
VFVCLLAFVFVCLFVFVFFVCVFFLFVLFVFVQMVAVLDSLHTSCLLWKLAQTLKGRWWLEISAAC